MLSNNSLFSLGRQGKRTFVVQQASGRLIRFRFDFASSVAARALRPFLSPFELSLVRDRHLPPQPPPAPAVNGTIEGRVLDTADGSAVAEGTKVRIPAHSPPKISVYIHPTMAESAFQVSPTSAYPLRASFFTCAAFSEPASMWWCR